MSVSMNGIRPAADRMRDKIKRQEDRMAALIDLLALALPYVEEAATDPAHKPEPVRALAQRIRAAIGTAG